MILDDYIRLCQSRDFEELASFLTSDIKDVYLKIVVTAIFEIYHPQDKPHGSGLAIWNKKLSGQMVSPMQNLFSGLVDLLDFVKAYQLADSSLADNVLAKAIKDYIYKHNIELSPILLSGVLDAESIKAINLLFPDLMATKQQREQQLKQQFTEEAKRDITFFKLTDAIRDLIAEILGIKLYQFTFSRYKNEGTLTFKDKFSSDYVEKVVKLLDLMMIRSNDYCFPSSSGMQRGIKVFSSIQSLHQSLNETRAMLKNPPQEPEKKTSFANISATLEELNQLKNQSSNFSCQYGAY